MKATGLNYNGKKEKLWKYYFPGGVLNAEINYRNDIPDSVAKYFNLKGRLHTLETWSGNNLNGPYIVYHANGQIMSEGIFLNGLQQGEWKTFYPNGVLNKAGSYDKHLKTGL